ncbi:hypothetical protein TgHK011_000600 [Trichoderma gracile]|nr:hypothetical protein TgHK011_000600 [Trichoderma gracile]
MTESLPFTRLHRLLPDLEILFCPGLRNSPLRPGCHSGAGSSTEASSQEATGTSDPLLAMPSSCVSIQAPVTGLRDAFAPAAPGSRHPGPRRSAFSRRGSRLFHSSSAREDEDGLSCGMSKSSQGPSGWQLLASWRCIKHAIVPWTRLDVENFVYLTC